MTLHADPKLRRTAVLALLCAALLAGCGSSSKPPARTRPTSTPASSTTSTAASPGATSRAPDKSGTKTTTTDRSHAHTGNTGSNSAPTPVPALHLHTAAIGGCSEGTTACVSKSTKVKPVGPYRIDANLVQLLARDQPTIKHAVVTCPASTSYPVSCKLTGEAPVHGKVVPIKGTITVIGVEVRTRTYAYETEYAPAHGG